MKSSTKFYDFGTYKEDNFGVLVAPHDVIKIFSFCNKIFRVSDLQGGSNPIDLLLIVIAQPVIIKSQLVCS